MSHDEIKPTWETELSFERRPDGEEQGAAAWEQELAKWRDDAPPPPAAPVDPAPPVPTPDPAPGLEWLTQPLEETVEPAPPVPVEPPAANEQLAPVVPISLPPPPAPSIESPEPVVAPPAALVEPATVVLPPEPVVDLATEPETPAPEPKVPFYKREISLGRKSRDAKPKAPKKRREKKPKAEAAATDASTETKVPFYKRELSLKRTETTPAAEPAEAPKKQKKETKEKAASPRPKLRRPTLPKPELGGGGKNTKRLVGLKIGASQIAAARVANSDSPQLLQAVSAPLEHGVVVGGELRDPEALAAALRDFFKQHNLPRKGIRLGIANNRIGVRTLEIVGIDDPKLLDNAVKFRAQEVLPIPIEDAVLDYQVLTESVEDGQPTRRVLLVVAYRDLVDRYVEACRQAGLQLVGIDLEAFALLRAIAEPKSDLQPLPGAERAALVAVSVGHDRSTFAISDGRICEFTRVLSWGGWSLNVAIARALDTSPSEAETVKRALSFEGADSPPPGFTAEQLAAAREAARGQLQSFARELVSSLQFYQNQPGSLGIGEIVVTGGTSHLGGVAAELERMVGVPVRVGDPLTRLKTGKGLPELEQVGSLAVAIGLGIED
jgi:type IV pilus assembly protein PilM